LETIKAIKSALDAHVNFERAAHSPRFFKAGKGEYAEGDQFLGVAVPDQRTIAKQFWQVVTADELAMLLLDPIHEVRLTAVFMLIEKFNKAKSAAEKEGWVNLYLRCIEGINNWDLVDSSAHKILGRWLEDKPRDLLYEFALTDHLWKQRIAIIATFWFIPKKDFTDALKIAEILLHHEHDLIHKAVGWMLREIGNRDQKTEEAFLKQHYHTMPRTALRYAIEKFEEGLRKAYLHGDI
jgi:3-methyladenine DNA glycosylase AlkD